MQLSASLWKATNKTNIKHNNREQKKYDNKLIDESRFKNNNYLIQEDLKKVYEKEFGAALKKYNEKQKRNDRKIKSYYDHIAKSKKTSLQQEIIIQIGEGDNFKFDDENWKIANEVLEEYFDTFKKRNPHLKIYNAVIHNDETTPHLHMNFVPVADRYKRGLEKQVSFDRAITQQDDLLDKKRPFDDWREKEINELEKIMNKNNIKRKLVGTNNYKDTNELKKVTEEREVLEKEKEVFEKQREAFLSQVNQESELETPELKFSHHEKVLEDYEEIKSTFFRETKEIKQREVETDNVVLTPEDIKDVLLIKKNELSLKAQNKRLEGLYREERDLHAESLKKHEKELKLLNKEIGERANRLKNDKMLKLQDTVVYIENKNKQLTNKLEEERNNLKVTINDYHELKNNYLNLEENYKKLDENYNSLEVDRNRWKYKFEILWANIKEYAKEHLYNSSEMIETIKSYFVFDAGEEIEEKKKEKKKFNDFEK